MFTLSSTPVKFCCLLVLFALSCGWEVVVLARSRSWTGRTSSLAHLLMAAVMLLMVPRAWWLPFHQAVGLPALIALMLLCSLWFAVRLARSGPGHRGHPAACLAMFVTMVWHLWAMQLMMAHSMAMTNTPPSTMDHSMPGMGSSMPGMGSSMPGMGSSMPGMAPAGASPWHEVASQPGHVLWWFAVAGVVLVAVMLWITVRDVLRAARGTGSRPAALAEAAMCFGMAWMSTGLLAPVAPWIGAVSF